MQCVGHTPPTRRALLPCGMALVHGALLACGSMNGNAESMSGRREAKRDGETERPSDQERQRDRQGACTDVVDSDCEATS